jgi:hypothetical protein
MQQRSWDDLGKNRLSPDQVLELARSTVTHVFIRTRKDGHPVGVVMGHCVLDDEIYALTNTTRSTFHAVQRDPRCCAVFERPEESTMASLIGEATPVDDPALLDRWFDAYSPTAVPVTGGKISAEEFRNFAQTANRRLIHIAAEKVISFRSTTRPPLA